MTIDHSQEAGHAVASARLLNALFDESGQPRAGTVDAVTLSETGHDLIVLINQGAVDDDLAAINSSVITRMKLLYANKNRRAIGQFEIGDRVTFARFEHRSLWLNGALAQITAISTRGNMKVTVRMLEDRGTYRRGSLVTCGPANLDLATNIEVTEVVIRRPIAALGSPLQED